jgi:hypothetical protein
MSAIVTVRVTATDGTDLTDTQVVAINVLNTAPTVVLPSSGSATRGAQVTWSGSFIDPGLDTWSATVDFGAGAGPQPLALNADKTYTLGHTYAAPGTYTITVRVSDDDGAIGRATFTVVVNPLPVNVEAARLVVRKGVLKSIVLTVSAALRADTANSPANYSLWLAGKDKKFGTKDDKHVKLRTPVYDEAENTITLTPKGRLAAATKRQLRVNGSAILDLLNRPLDGNRDLQPGGDFVATLKKKKVTVQSLAPSLTVREAGASRGVAIDQLLEQVPFTPVQRRKLRR